MLTATSALFLLAPVAKAWFRRIENADLRHADTGFLRLTTHRFDDPALGVVARLLDELHTHHALGAPLRHGERDEGAAEAEHGSKHEQAVQAAPLGGDVLIDAEHLHHDRQYEDDGEVGGKEQQNTFHTGQRLLCQCDRLFQSTNWTHSSDGGSVRTANLSGSRDDRQSS